MPSKLFVTVKPQARREKIEKASEGDYIAAVRAPARDGRANEAVIELLAAYFAVPKSSLRIVRGQKSKRKLVEIS